MIRKVNVPMQIGTELLREQRRTLFMLRCSIRERHATDDYLRVTGFKPTTYCQIINALDGIQEILDAVFDATVEE